MKVLLLVFAFLAVSQVECVFHIGKNVVLQNLRTSGLNGKKGQITGSSNGRMKVKLEDDEREVAIKAENLISAEEVPEMPAFREGDRCIVNLHGLEAIMLAQHGLGFSRIVGVDAQTQRIQYRRDGDDEVQESDLKWAHFRDVVLVRHEMKLGDLVKVAGLRSEKARWLNGSTCFIAGVRADGRLLVEVVSRGNHLADIPMAVKPQNLTPTEGTPLERMAVANAWSRKLSQMMANMGRNLGM